MYMIKNNISPRPECPIQSKSLRAVHCYRDQFYYFYISACASGKNDTKNETLIPVETAEQMFHRSAPSFCSVMNICLQMASLERQLCNMYNRKVLSGGDT
ncbi:prostaglandin E2 receptor EP1 subtype [Platysternon megacephalum]|uniref:Prostaglandin E2 receptor EP1 subtype n=1 Tax=Platysternon megacephalum TaxID=55544 RepID=A0A4D9DXR2_9SAUR|nr:prostaglandin E2 receptor EP1 subtype [Platysternon megacephalum]